MHLSYDGPSRLSRLMFTLLMLLAFAGAPQWSSMTAMGADVSQPPNFATTADRLEKLLGLIAEEDQQLPRDTFDLSAVLKATGNDSTSIFHWVRDRTNWIPYRGELRGAVGVLMDRMGNSLDRSILLAELLRKAGFTVRLAHAKLDPQLAAATLSHIRTSSAEAAIPLAGLPKSAADNVLSIYSQKLSTPTAELRATLDAAEAQSQRLSERCLARSADQTQALAQLLKLGAAPSDDAAAMLSNHFWVQQQKGSDWSDLDPMLPDAEPGHAVASAREVIPLPADDKPIALPDSFQQLVTVRVFVEQIIGKKRKAKPVVSAVIHPASVIGQRIYIANVPMQWPRDNAIFTSDKPAETVKKLVLAQREFLPTIHVGDESTHAGSFDIHGNVNEHPDFTGLGVAGTSTVSAGKSVLDAFGGGETPAADSGKPSGTLIAQWIEYEIQTPGQPAKKFRRDVFVQEGYRPGDSADSEPQVSTDQQMKRGLSLLANVEILVAPCQLTGSFVSHLTISHLLADKETKIGMLRDSDLQHRKTLADDFNKLSTMPGELLEWATLRHRLSRHAKDVCIQSPTLLTYLSMPSMNRSGQLAVSKGFDLIDVPIALRPGSNADGVQVALEQGVLDTNLEASLVLSPGHTLNTSEIMAAGEAQGVNWIAINDPKDARLAASGLSSEARSRIAQDLADGNHVVIPAKPIAIDGELASTWWRVNPSTGQTLGMMEDGRGVAMPSYGYVLAAILGLLVGGFSYAGCIGDGGSNAKVVGCIGCGVLLGVLAAVGVFAIWSAPEAAIGIALALLGGLGAPACYYASKVQ